MVWACLLKIKKKEAEKERPQDDARKRVSKKSCHSIFPLRPVETIVSDYLRTKAMKVWRVRDEWRTPAGSCVPVAPRLPESSSVCERRLVRGADFLRFNASFLKPREMRPHPVRLLQNKTPPAIAFAVGLPNVQRWAEATAYDLKIMLILRGNAFFCMPVAYSGGKKKKLVWSLAVLWKWHDGKQSREIAFKMSLYLHKYSISHAACSQQHNNKLHYSHSLTTPCKHFEMGWRKLRKLMHWTLSFFVQNAHCNFSFHARF